MMTYENTAMICVISMCICAAALFIALCVLLVASIIQLMRDDDWSN